MEPSQLGGQLRKYGPVRVTPIKVERQNYYRVRIGPIASVTEADKTLKRMIADGHPWFTALGGPEWSFQELPTGHWPMFSRPDDLAELLIDIPPSEAADIE